MNKKQKKRIEFLKQKSRDLTKEGKIKKATKVFNKAWDLEWGKIK